MRRFKSIAELGTAVGQELGVSSWVTIDQQMIDRFAEATGDFQWIHVDRERAAKSQYGATIAHGFLTLSLMARLRDEIYEVDGIAWRINYGCDKVRFVAPVPSGSRVRLSMKLTEVEPARQGVRMVTAATVELDGSARPAVVADHIVLLVPE